MIFDQNFAIYTVVYKESESEVKKCKRIEYRAMRGNTVLLVLLLSVFYLFCACFFPDVSTRIDRNRPEKLCICSRTPLFNSPDTAAKEPETPVTCHRHLCKF